MQMFAIHAIKCKRNGNILPFYALPFNGNTIFDH